MTTEFDKYATDYLERMNRNLGALGESSTYFDEHKVRLLKQFLAGQGQAMQSLCFLDFGCGMGRTTPYMLQHFPQVKYHGIDVSKDSINHAQAQFPQAQFQVFDGGHIPYGEQTFDVVFLSGVVHHIPPEKRGAIFAEIRRVLKPQGYVFIVEHNPWNPLTRYMVATCEFDENAKLVGCRKLKTLLRQAGFQFLESKFIVFFPKFLRNLIGDEKEEYLRWLPLGGQYLVVASQHAV